MIKRKTIERSRIDRILHGELRGVHEDFVENRDHRFAYAFLLLTEIVTGKVVPIDESRLETVPDKLEYLKNSQDVYAARFELGYRWYKTESGPFIGFRGEEKKPVVLQFRRGCYHMLTDDDTEVKVDEKIAREFDGEGICIISKAPGEIRSGKKLLFCSARKSAPEFVIFLAIMLLGTAIASIIPSMAGYITSELIPNGESAGIYILTISLVLGILAGLLINIAVNYTKARMQTKTAHLMVSAVIGRIMAMRSEDESKLSGRISSLIMMFECAADTILGSSISVLVFLAQGLMALRTMLSMNGEISLLIWLLTIADIAFIAVMEILIYRKTAGERDLSARLSLIRREMLDNMEVIRNNAIEDKSFYRFAIAYDEKMRLRQQIENYSQTVSIVGTLLSGIGLFLIYSYAAGNSTGNAGMVSAMVTSFTLMTSYLNSMTSSFSETVSALPHLKFADDVLKTPPEETDTGAADYAVSGNIELTNVSFSYSEGDCSVLRNLNLNIRPGEYIGIVGPSGCGKSTLIKLMLGFLKPTEGKVRFDGIDIERYNLRSLRRQFGVVLQDAAVLTGSITRNIALTDDADMDLVKEAARQAAVLDDIEAMPMKFHTMLSGEAEVISGGQRQRIVLARALMRNPRILFLDEATSAIDNAAQKTIKENLDKLGITRIVIAHRLSTVVNCDRILVLDRGRIAETGTYQQLMEKNGLFANMARRNIL